MSANNILIIRKKDNKWEIRDTDVEAGMQGYTVDRTNTLEDAIDIANEYMKENEVEYGLRITNQ